MEPNPVENIPLENLTTLQQFQVELQALMAKYPTIQLEVVQNIQARDTAILPTVPATPKKSLWPKRKSK